MTPSKENEQTFRTIILAGGKGTRLLPYTAVLPKPLMPIGGMPILEIVIRQLRRAGFCDITMSVGYLSSLLQAFFDNGSKWGVAIEYSAEDEPLGTAGPLSLVDGLTSTFLVMNGDLLTTLDYAAMVKYHHEHDAVATVGMFHKKVKIDLGVLKISSTNSIKSIIGYDEKPTLEYQVSMGIYVMEPRVLQYIPSGRALDLPDLVKTLIANNERVIGYPFEGHWLDIGRQEDYACATELFEQDRSLFLQGEI